VSASTGRVLGLGAAGEGTAEWWAQRVSAVALALLGVWFLQALIRLPDFGHDTVAAWLHRPVHALLLMLFIATAAYHSELGVKVVVEDYVRGGLKVASLVTLTLLHILVAAAGIYAVIRVALGGGA
jgi:succinate dehydrogenase / fumarate reductase, membrane anchor subunit